MAAIEESSATRPAASGGVGVDAVLRKLPRRLNRRGKSGNVRRLPAIIELLLTLALLVMLTRIVWLLFAPLPLADAPAPVVPAGAAGAVDAATVKSPFGRMASLAPVESAEPDLTDVQETSLDLKLHGVWQDSIAEENSSAIISASGGAQGAFRIGDEIISNVTLEAVYQNQVTINSNGVIESLRLPKEFEDDPAAAPARPLPDAPQGLRNDGPASARSLSAGEDEAFFDSDNPETVLDIVSFEPSIDSTGEAAIAVYALENVRAFEETGLREGDIVRAVENQRIVEIGDVIGKVADKESVKLLVERGGAPIEIIVDLKKVGAN